MTSTLWVIAALTLIVALAVIASITILIWLIVDIGLDIVEDVHEYRRGRAHLAAKREEVNGR